MARLLPFFPMVVSLGPLNYFQRYMKQFIFLCLGLSLIVAPCLVRAQSPASEPNYLRYPVVPPISMTTASGKVFTNQNLKKHKPIMIMLFSVDCEHCQHQTQEITANISRFRGAQLIMITPSAHSEMYAFYQGYGISKYPDVITMGTDSTRRLNMFYQQRFFPGIYIYNKDNHLVYHHEGTAKIDTLVHYLHQR